MSTQYNRKQRDGRVQKTQSSASAVHRTRWGSTGYAHARGRVTQRPQREDEK